MADDNQESAGAVGEGSAEAQQMPESIPESALQPMSPEEIRQRQAAFSKRRLQAGLIEETEAESSAVSLPDERETDCAPPDNRSDR